MPTATVPRQKRRAPAMPPARRATRASGGAAPAAKPKRPRWNFDLTIDTEASDRFMALPMAERDRILDEFQAKLQKAFTGMTLDELLADMRKDKKNGS